ALNNIDIKLTPKQIEKYLLGRIERFEAFEERLGVRFENISVKVESNDSFRVFFELYSNSGTNLDENTVLIDFVVYDIDGKILKLKTDYASKDRFFGYQIFEFGCYENSIIDKVGKIKLFPKK
ncbi:MAG: hypothetical protein RL308_3430, partial [Bacteroidota bacterium]